MNPPARLLIALAAVLAAVPAPTSAAETFAQWAWDRTAASCAGAVQGDTMDFDGGARCIGDRLIGHLDGFLGGLLVNETARFLTEQGRETFGEHFSLVHRMTWSPLGQGLAGELDAVVPLGFLGGGQAGAGDAEGLHGSAFFLQQGVTRWTDAHGFRRHDVRLGTAFRFALPHFAGADVVGAAAMVQENVERGHQRLVLGTDYAGRWGHASLQHYLPTTEWRAGRAGYEERAAGRDRAQPPARPDHHPLARHRDGPVGARRRRAVRPRRAPRPGAGRRIRTCASTRGRASAPARTAARSGLR